MNTSEFDFHIHSKFSFDSLMSPKKIVAVAKKVGLNGIAIVDHNSIEGGLEAKKLETEDFTVIVGSEIKTKEGDIIGIFLNENIISSDLFETIDLIHGQGGLAVLPHPLESHNLNVFTRDMFEKLDAIEGFNGRVSPVMNSQALQLAEKFKIPVIAGSDAHFYGEIGAARTIIRGLADMADIRMSLLSSNTVITGNQTAMYYRGGSRIVSDVKTKSWHKLPVTLIKITLKGLKTYSNKVRSNQ